MEEQFATSAGQSLISVECVLSTLRSTEATPLAGVSPADTAEAATHALTLRPPPHPGVQMKGVTSLLK